MSVNPKVIETPNISAVAKDGIELLVKARVTVRTNLDRLVGGAGEETIIARVGEGIVTTVGSSETHKAVLENPDSISRTVLAKGLDAGTAYEILSIDIADVDVGRNIGAQLAMDQAEADRRIAQAKAEERRAMAVAKEQENIAYVQEMRARVVEAEAEVPRAMAEALRSGRNIDTLLVVRGERNGSVGRIIAECKEKGVVIKEVDKKKLFINVIKIDGNGLAGRRADASQRLAVQKQIDQRAVIEHFCTDKIFGTNRIRNV